MIRTVKTENGVVRGLPASDPRVTSFKGIPFAAPPVGKNRWRAPQPCMDWQGIRDAYQFGPISVQDTPGLGTDIYCREWHVEPEIAMGEDCLYLNVWTNAKRGDEKLPVLVWFFGGGFQWGYTAEMEMDGERIARRDIVVVTVNYRLNAFGFLAHPDLTSQQGDAPANFGLLDQQAGLRWVIRNIAAFGGDPENITIAGQSAGAGSVMHQMASPTNQGAFQKAIMMSGMFQSPYGEKTIGTPFTLQEAEKNGTEFLKFLGVSTIEEARRLDALLIRDKYAEYAQTHMRMIPVWDERFCVGDTYRQMLQGQYAKVPILLGNTADEFFCTISADSDEAYEKKVRELLGEDADLFLSFPEARKKQGDSYYAPVNSVECAIKSFVAANEKNGSDNNCYYYRFDADIPGEDHPGTFHSVDLWFFFETLAKCTRPFQGRHYDLSRMMCNYLANFIKTGDPNGCDADGMPMPIWQPYCDKTPCDMVFRTDGVRSECVKDSGFMEFVVKRVLENNK